MEKAFAIADSIKKSIQRCTPPCCWHISQPESQDVNFYVPDVLL